MSIFGLNNGWQTSRGGWNSGIHNATSSKNIFGRRRIMYPGVPAWEIIVFCDLTKNIMHQFLITGKFRQMKANDGFQC